MANLAARAYGIGAPIMSTMELQYMMGTDGRIYRLGTAPADVRLFRLATKEERERWSYLSGKGGTPPSFDVRAEVAAYDKQFQALAAGPKPNLGTMSGAPSNDLAPEVKGGILGFSSGALLIIAIVVGAVVFGGK